MSENFMQMTTGAGLDAMTKMLPHVMKIVGDEEYAAIKAKGKNKDMRMMDAVGAIFPFVVTKHRAELYGIVSAVTGKTVEEVEKQPIADTVACFDDATGGDVIGFFLSCARMVMRL